MALIESSNKRLAKNTIFLYFRTIVLLIIGIFTSRITLQVLGVDNYGIVNVVSGFVAMFTLISGSLTTACQRFITFELGQENPDVHSVFNTSVQVHLILSAIVIVLAETLGLYFVNFRLNLPESQHTAIQWVYQCSIISFIISLINIPYNAIIIAHEKMSVFAYISLLEGILKLLVVVALLYINSNKLILYSILGLTASIIVRLTFQIYCRKTFNHIVKINRRVSRSLIKKISGFAGWSFIGNSATILSNQGVNILLNIFCGVAVNAARGIAVMVENVITNFVTNFTTALNPQITKSYAAGNSIELNRLMQLGVRLTSCLMLLLAIPIIICSTDLLNIWFVDVPIYAPIFVKLTLIIATIQAIANPFLTLMLSSGEIRNYQICVGLITFLNLPFSYLFLKSDFSPIIVYYLAIFICVLNFILRLFFVYRITKFNCFDVLKSIAPRIVGIYSASIMICVIIYRYMFITDIWKLFLFGIITTLLNLILIFFVGLNTYERLKVTNKLINQLKDLRNHA